MKFKTEYVLYALAAFVLYKHFSSHPTTGGMNFIGPPIKIGANCGVQITSVGANCGANSVYVHHALKVQPKQSKRPVPFTDAAILPYPVSIGNGSYICCYRQWSAR
jgi:hypothetical protein